MNTTFTISDSLIGSLCREIDSIRNRVQGIVNTKHSTLDNRLKSRLEEEMISLRQRQHEIMISLENYVDSKNSDNLSIQFLIELSKRV